MLSFACLQGVADKSDKMAELQQQHNTMALNKPNVLLAEAHTLLLHIGHGLQPCAREQKRSSPTIIAPKSSTILLRSDSLHNTNQHVSSIPVPLHHVHSF